MFKLRINIFLDIFLLLSFLEFCTYMRVSFPLVLVAPPLDTVCVCVCVWVLKWRKIKRRDSADVAEIFVSSFHFWKFPPPKRKTAKKKNKIIKNPEMMNRVTQIQKRQEGCLRICLVCQCVCQCVVQTCLKFL